MFGNFIGNAKSKLMGAMLEKQLAKLPVAQREMIKKAVTENPELFQKIAMEVQEKKKQGMSDQQAAMVVMPKYKDELAKVMQPKK
jgi:hypothetical protein